MMTEMGNLYAVLSAPGPKYIQKIKGDIKLCFRILNEFTGTV